MTNQSIPPVRRESGVEIMGGYFYPGIGNYRVCR